MATLAEAAQKKKELSSLISTLIRTVSVSVLAVAWLFLSESDDTSTLLHLVPKSQTLVIAAMCILALGLDLIQCSKSGCPLLGFTVAQLRLCGQASACPGRGSLDVRHFALRYFSEPVRGRTGARKVRKGIEPSPLTILDTK